MFSMTELITSAQAAQIWEDTVGDSGKAPTDEELAAFANAVGSLAWEAGVADLDEVITVGLSASYLVNPYLKEE